MSSWRAPIRPYVAALAAVAACLTAASSASAAIVINEVESDGAADFIELTNTGPLPVDLGGWVLRDNNNGNSQTIPAGTVLAAGGYFTAFPGFGLGSADSARVFAPGDLNNPVDQYSWTAHAFTTYGRCPDGTGAMTWTNRPTQTAANDCPPAAAAWPGGVAIADADDIGIFGTNLSGLAYQPSGTKARGVLWAVQNGPSTLYRLVHDGTKWVRDTTGGWATGKQLVYTGGGGVPDAEGITLVTSDPNAVYVSTERDDTGGGNTSRPAVLRYDTTAAGAPLTATNDWNLTADLPGLAPNAGLEAIAWVPDSLLVAKGFFDEARGATYDPANYPGHGAGPVLRRRRAGRPDPRLRAQRARDLHARRDDRERLPGGHGARVRARDLAPLGGVRRQLRRPRRDARHRADGPLHRHRHVRPPGRHGQPQQRGLHHRPAGRVHELPQARVLDRRQRHQRARHPQRHAELHGPGRGP